MIKKKLLVIGTVPLPIGGVTIHTQRALAFLKKDNFDFVFFDYKRASFFSLLKSLASFDVVHSHISNQWVRAFIVLWCRLFGNKVIVTFHGRYDFKNFFDKLTLRFAQCSLLLNTQTLDCAKKITTKGNPVLTTAFIPPLHNDPLPDTWHARILELRQNVRKLFCTNAFNRTFDGNGQEIYGISSLVEIFNKHPESGLVISDPSGNYQKYFEANHIACNDNLLFINVPHDYVTVLKMADYSIRATTTDGDSLSVKESLYFNTPVIASDCVDRPKGCILFQTGNKDDLERVIVNVDNFTLDIPEISNAYHDMLARYKQVLNT